MRDFGWWAGLRAADARAGLELARARLASHTHGNLTYWFAEERAPDPEPRISLLPCYDELVVACSERRDVLRTATATLPPLGHHDGYRHVVVRDGRLLGHWRVREDGQGIETRLVRPLAGEEAAALAAASDRCVRFARPA